MSRIGCRLTTIDVTSAWSRARGFVFAFSATARSSSRAAAWATFRISLRGARQEACEAEDAEHPRTPVRSLLLGRELRDGSGSKPRRKGQRSRKTLRHVGSP